MTIYFEYTENSDKRVQIECAKHPDSYVSQASDCSKISPGSIGIMYIRPKVIPRKENKGLFKLYPAGRHISKQIK